MKEQRSSRCYPSSGCVLNSLLSITPNVMEDDRIDPISLGSKGSSYEKTYNEMSSKKSGGLIVRGNNRFPLEQPNKSSMSRLTSKPTGIMALICQTTKIANEDKTFSPREVGSVPHSPGVTCGSQPNISHLPVQKSIPRPSFRSLNEQQSMVQSVEEVESENDKSSNCKERHAKDSQRKQPTLNYITPSPKRKLGQGNSIIKPRNIEVDMQSVIMQKSSRSEEAINLNEKGLKRKIRVRSSSKNSLKRLTLALAKSVTVGKKTIPSRSTVATEVRPIALSGSEDLNEFPLEGSSTSQLKKAFLGTPPRNLNNEESPQTKKAQHSLDTKDTIKEWSKKVDENRRYVMELTSKHQHRHKETLKKDSNKDQRIQEIVDYMDGLIHHVESMKEKVKMTPDANLVPLKTLRTRFPMFTEMDLFLKQQPNYLKDKLSKKKKDEKQKEMPISTREDVTAVSPSFRKSQAVSPSSSITLKRKRTASISDDEESLYMRRWHNLLYSDDSSIESNNSRKYTDRKFKKSRHTLVQRTRLMQHNNTLMHIGSKGKDFFTCPVNQNAAAATDECNSITPKIQGKKDAMSKINFVHEMDSSITDETDIDDILERKWREQDALALISTETQLKTDVDNVDEFRIESGEEDPLSIFF